MLIEETILGKFDKLNHSMKRYFERYFSGSTLTGMQAIALYHIITRAKYHDVFPKDLEESLALKSSSVSSLLNYLEQNGYIRREPYEHDARCTKLVVTEQTLQAENDIVEWFNSYTRSIFKNVSEQDLSVFNAVLSQMIDNITKPDTPM